MFDKRFESRLSEGLSNVAHVKAVNKYSPVNHGGSYEEEKSYADICWHEKCDPIIRCVLPLMRAEGLH